MMPAFEEYILFLKSDCYIFPDVTLIDGWLQSKLIKTPDLQFKRKLTFENSQELYTCGYKLLLRPLSNMTPEELKVYSKLVDMPVPLTLPGNEKEWIPIVTKGMKYLISKDFDIFNWIEEEKALDKTHLDITNK